MAGDFLGIQYNFLLASGDNAGATAPSQSQVENFDLLVRLGARMAFGPNVQVDFTIIESEELVDPQADATDQPLAEATGQSVGAAARPAEVKAEPAEGLFAPEVQHKLDMSPIELIPAKALGISEKFQKRDHSRIINTLDRAGVGTIRRLYLLGPALEEIPYITSQSLENLQSWLNQQLPEMPQLMIDANAPVTPEFAATFCTDLSQIQVGDIPELFKSDKIALLSDVSIAEYVFTRGTETPPAGFRQEHDRISNYVRRFEAAKAQMAKPGLQN